MAKASFWLRGAQGTFAGAVLQKGSSGTIIREKVDPVNVKAPGQVYQRASFKAASRFFKLCKTKFFQFAYNDLRQGESYYNAFMRKNVKFFAPVFSHIEESPLFCPFVDGVIMTEGSLGSYETRVAQDDSRGGTNKYHAGLVLKGQKALKAWEETVEGKAKVGDFWKIIVAENPGVHNGDFITVLGLPETHYNIDKPGDELDQVAADVDPTVKTAEDAMFFMQFKVDVNDKTEYEDPNTLPFGYACPTGTDDIVIGTQGAVTPDEVGSKGRFTIGMWCAVLSRDDASGFACSNSVIVNTSVTEDSNFVSDTRFFDVFCTEEGAQWADPYVTIDYSTITPAVKRAVLVTMGYEVAEPAVLQGNVGAYRQ